MRKTSSSSRGEKRPHGDPLFALAVAGVLVAVSWLIPPLALALAFCGVFFRAPRRFTEFWENLRLYWRRNIGSLFWGLVVAGLISLIIAIPLFIFGSCPEFSALLSGFALDEIFWLGSVVFFGLTGLFWGVLFHVLARKPKKAGVRL